MPHMRAMSAGKKEVHYKIQIHVTKEFTPAIDRLGQNILKSGKKKHFFLELINQGTQLLLFQPITMDYFAYLC